MSQRQCLPIDEENSSDTDSELNFDLSQISAHKYLKNVRLERERIKEIVSVTIPKDYDNSQQTDQVENSTKRPFQTKEWQEYQKELFENLQRKICNIRSSKNTDRTLDILPMNVEEESDCIKYCQQNDPLMSVVLTLDNCRQVENFVEIMADYLSENLDDLKSKDLNELAKEFAWIGKWTYALIACLRIPLGPEVHNSIRTIAKNCIALVDHFQGLSNSLPLNLLITIIVNNFHQYDLLSL